jgi:hypothetical protein
MIGSKDNSSAAYWDATWETWQSDHPQREDLGQVSSVHVRHSG